MPLDDENDLPEASMLATRVEAAEARTEAETSSVEREIARLSATFINLPADAIDAHIEQAIGWVADFFDIDRVTVGQQRAPGTDGLRITHQWVRAGCPRLEDQDGYVPERSVPCVLARIAQGQIVTFSKPDDLPEEAARDKKLLGRIGARSNAIVPVTVAGAPIGWLGFSVLRQEREWTVPVVEQLRRVSSPPVIATIATNEPISM